MERMNLETEGNVSETQDIEDISESEASDMGQYGQDLDETPYHDIQNLFTRLLAQLNGVSHFIPPGEFAGDANYLEPDEYYVTIVNHLDSRRACFRTKDSERLYVLIARAAKLLKVIAEPLKLKWEFYNSANRKTLAQAHINYESVLRLIVVEPA
ncbi:hypothetical protein GYMLUDRAFT_242002 [Collybiopsis luxurians FD-317 M1]|uniref:Uncharacterized protein n=1 Tax=Collybiopsis luxurians FD-317 M1 TaxID=944289 RepID=A0A0D0D1C8_9AGAR|nr:hypothetical protein GYMLUDRAFT_242002 [Collybiopsis luxurians FD-317 M1]